METHPLVSVVLPVWNGAAHLADAVDSALAQTYPALELIVVDDGSTDATPAMLDQYAARDSRIRILRQANGGVARARNQAIAAARGEFIAPLDADDLWHPEKIARQVQRFAQAGGQTALVYCWWAWIDEDNAVFDHSPHWRVEGRVFESLLQINFIGSASVPMFRKRAVEQAGGYDESMRAHQAGGCEDWLLALRIADLNEVAVVPETLLGYRRRAGSMSAACDTMWRSKERVLDEVRRLRPGTDPRILRRASQQFAMYLAGLSFWSGNHLATARWMARAGLRLPASVAPHMLRMLTRLSRKQTQPVIFPGVRIPVDSLPEPYLPYDTIPLLTPPSA